MEYQAIELSGCEVFLLGGDYNGLNFEIEYLDQRGKTHEALYSVRHDYAGEIIEKARIHPTGLRFKLGTREFVVGLPGGCARLNSFRQPVCLGSNQLVLSFKRNNYETHTTN